MIKILFVVPRLPGIGGVESSLINLMDTLIKDGNFDIDLLVLDNHIEVPSRIPKTVKLVKSPKLLQYSLFKYKNWKNEISLFTKIKVILMKVIMKIINYENTINTLSTFFSVNEKYDVAVSYTNDIYQNNKMTSGGSNHIVRKSIVASKKISWIHNEADKEGLSYDICKKTYKDFDSIVNVSYACKSIFDNIIPEFAGKSKVVYNTFAIENILDKANHKENPYNEEKFNIVSVGRVAKKQKRMERIIDLAKNLLEFNIDNFFWTVVGDGPELNEFKEKVLKNNLSEYVNFIGKKDNPYLYMKYADVLVLTSDRESYGMVIKESMIVGTPVISTRFNAVDEVIDDNINGIIVDYTKKGMSITIKDIIEDKNKLHILNENIKKKEITNNNALLQFKSLCDL